MPEGSTGASGLVGACHTATGEMTPVLVSALRACRSPIHSPDLYWARKATGAPSAKSLPVSTEPELEP